MAEGEFGAAEVKQLGVALQAIRRGEAGALDVHASEPARAEARSTALEFVRAFELDVAVSDLSDGFRLELPDSIGRTITLNL